MVERTAAAAAAGSVGVGSVGAPVSRRFVVHDAQPASNKRALLSSTSTAASRKRARTAATTTTTTTATENGNDDDDEDDDDNTDEHTHGEGEDVSGGSTTTTQGESSTTTSTLNDSLDLLHRSRLREQSDIHDLNSRLRRYISRVQTSQLPVGTTASWSRLQSAVGSSSSTSSSSSSSSSSTAPSSDDDNDATNVVDADGEYLSGATTTTSITALAFQQYVAKLNEQRSAHQQQLADYRDREVLLREQLATAEERERDLNAKVRNLQEQVELAKNAVDALDTSVKVARQDHLALTHKYLESQHSVNALTVELAAAKEETIALRATVAEWKQKLEHEQRTVSELRALTAQLRDELEATTQQSSTERAQVRAHVDAQARQLVEIEQRLRSEFGKEMVAHVQSIQRRVAHDKSELASRLRGAHTSATDASTPSDELLADLRRAHEEIARLDPLVRQRDAEHAAVRVTCTTLEQQIVAMEELYEAQLNEQRPGKIREATLIVEQQSTIASLNERITGLVNAQLNLGREIAQYRALLEHEEERLGARSSTSTEEDSEESSSSSSSSSSSADVLDFVLYPDRRTIVVENVSGAPVPMQDYVVRTARSAGEFGFADDLVLQPGEAVRIVSGDHESLRDARHSLGWHVPDETVWSPNEVICLINPHGVIVAREIVPARLRPLQLESQSRASPSNAVVEGEEAEAEAAVPAEDAAAVASSSSSSVQIEEEELGAPVDADAEQPVVEEQRSPVQSAINSESSSGSNDDVSDVSMMSAEEFEDRSVTIEDVTASEAAF